MRFRTTSAQFDDVHAIVIFLSESNVANHQALSISARHAKKGEVTIWRDAPVKTIAIGLGDVQPLDQDAGALMEAIRYAAGQAGRAAQDEEWSHIGVHLPGLLTAHAEIEAIVEGITLGTYRFDKYKAKKHEVALEEVVIEGVQDAQISEAIKKAQAYARATAIARDLANEPPNHMRPSVLADFVMDHFAETDACVTVYADEQLIAHQFVGLLTVGKGSNHSPRMVKIELYRDPSLPLVALIGKGITFDTGGISLKSGRDISDMRMDMAGAAAVVGAIDAVVQLNVPCNVVGFLAAAENIPDAGSMLPGELIQYPNGVSVQVANTDAEGRLVLADALIAAQEMGANFIVDIATLTGAAANALGPRYGAVMGAKGVVQSLIQAGSQTGDWVWPLPLIDEYEDQLKSDYADISNIGKGPAGAITAGLFLRRFVKKDAHWAHVDMAGPMDAERTAGYHAAGATGFGVRLLAQWAISQSRATTL